MKNKDSRSEKEKNEKKREREKGRKTHFERGWCETL